MDYATIIKFLNDLKQDPALLPVIAAILVVIPLVTKGLYTLTSAQHAKRNDAIDLWLKLDVINKDIPLELLTLHSFGVRLPATTILRIQLLHHPVKVFTQLRPLMDNIESTGTAGTLRLKDRVANTSRRRVEVVGWAMGYGASLLLALLLFGVFNVDLSKMPIAIRIVWGALLCIVAVFSLRWSAAAFKAPEFAKDYPELFVAPANANRTDPKPDPKR